MILFKLLATCLGAAQPFIPNPISNTLDTIFNPSTTPRTDAAAATECEYVYETEYATSYETECSDGWTKVCHTTYKNDCKETVENSCWKEFGPECIETPSQQCVTSKGPTETEVCEDEDVKECGRDGHNCKDVKKPVCRRVKKYSSKTTCYDIMIHNCQEVGREVCKSSPEQKCTLVPDGQDCKDVPIKSCWKTAKQSPTLSQKCKDKPGVGEWGKK